VTRKRDSQAPALTSIRAGTAIASTLSVPVDCQEPTMTSEQSTVQDWLRLIKAEYLEMPGLQLTKPQVRRLWRLEPQMCDVLLDSLIATEFLEKTDRDAYVLAQMHS